MKKCKKGKNKPKCQVDLLTKNPEIKMKFAIAVQNRFDKFKDSIAVSLEENILLIKEKQHQTWITNELLNVMNERREVEIDTCKNKDINKLIKNKCNEAKGK